MPYLVTTEWSDELQSVVGKFEVSPTPQAQQLWEIVKTRPDMYEFGISYTEDPETGKKELLGLSLIMKPPCNEK